MMIFFYVRPPKWATLVLTWARNKITFLSFSSGLAFNNQRTHSALAQVMGNIVLETNMY